MRMNRKILKESLKEWKKIKTENIMEKVSENLRKSIQGKGQIKSSLDSLEHKNNFY